MKCFAERDTHERRRPPYTCFLILRPQQKRVKAHKEMIDSLKKGDTVITQGGLIGKISKIISDQEVEIEIAKDVKVKAVRGMISDIKK